MARPYYLEAMRLVTQGIATIEEVDAIMEATGFKMGPFKLMDLIGLDVNYAVNDIVYNALDQPERLQPSPLQKEKIDEGKLGKKSRRRILSVSTIVRLESGTVHAVLSFIIILFFSRFYFLDFYLLPASLFIIYCTFTQ